MILFCQENTIVEFTLSDWMTLTSNTTPICDWTIKSDAAEHEIHYTQNVTIKRVVLANNILLQIRNNHNPKKMLFLNFSEYNKCIEMSLFVQNMMRSMQANWIDIEDYYNFYIQKCNARRKIVLEEQDFFTVDNANFDIYRLFKEISIFCSDKLQSDVMFNKVHE